MIKVRYSGYCIVGYWNDLLNSKHSPVVKVSGFFYLPPQESEDFEYIEYAVITKLLYQKGELKADSLVAIITDKLGNSMPFTIEKGRLKYHNPNGDSLNSLALIFDDDTQFNDDPAPLSKQDVEPTEKPLSESKERTHLNIIHGLLEMLKKSGKSQNEIISELEKFDYFGMSESNLKKLFAKANDIKKREH